MADQAVFELGPLLGQAFLENAAYDLFIDLFGDIV